MSALPITSAHQTDFSELGQQYLYVVDNNGKHFVIDSANKRRYSADGPGARNAARVLFGSPITNVFLTNYEEPGSAVDLFGGPNQMERVVAGQIPNPLTGEFIQNPQSVTTASGLTFDVELPDEPDLTTGETPPEAEREQVSFLDRARAQMPWMPEEVLQQYADAWAETGDTKVAIGQTRQSKAYREHFRGNIREDGSVRMDERSYMAGKNAYKDILGEYGIPPSEFEHRYSDLVSNDVSPREFQARMDQTYQQVLSQGQRVRQAYADFYSGDISDSAILASALEPGTNPLVFEQRFRAAQIGSEAGRFGFDVVRSDAERLARHGLDRQAGRQFFARAKDLLPTIGSLIERHNDPDDNFDLRDLEEALILNDPEEMNQIERLFAQESSSFSPTAGTFAGSGTGVTGLRPR